MYKTEERSREIENFLEDFSREADFENAEWSEDVIERLVDLACRGKMVRGSLLMDACERMGGCPDSVNYAAAVELIHTGLLVHDDIIDEDGLRRGVKTLHRQYSDVFDIENPVELGKKMAICAGDIAFFLAFRMVSSARKDNFDALQMISRTFSRVGMGEMKDIESSTRDRELSQDQIIELYRNKTASYTFALPLRLASVIAGKGDQPVLQKVGMRMGVLYQIKDDHFDFFPGDNIGKPERSDLDENKRTLHRALLLQEAGESEELRRKLREYGEEGNAELIRQKMQQHSIQEKMRERMEDLVDDIRATADEIGDRETRELVKDVTELIVQRNR
ncbi:MAG: polyprenyl synthetase family protein [Candidatus Nanohaloarchaea archaeon]